VTLTNTRGRLIRLALVIVLAFVIGSRSISKPGSGGGGENASWQHFMKAGAQCRRDLDFDGADRNYAEAVAACRKLPSRKKDLSMCLRSLGGAYLDRNKFSLAEAALIEAAAINRETNGGKKLALEPILINLSKSEIGLTKYKQAEETLKELLAIYQEVSMPPNSDEIVLASTLMGDAYACQKEKDLARRAYEVAGLVKKTGSDRDFASVLAERCSHYAAFSYWAAAQQIGLRALQMIGSSAENHREDAELRIKILKNLSEAYSMQGNIQQAEESKAAWQRLQSRTK
jgi:tetratricopeptide (TPR) repeat protein